MIRLHDPKSLKRGTILARVASLPLPPDKSGRKGEVRGMGLALSNDGKVFLLTIMLPTFGRLYLVQLWTKLLVNIIFSASIATALFKPTNI